MSTTISANELAKHLDEVLAHVQKQGEEYAIERDGKVIARLAPSSLNGGATWPELVRLWKSLPKGDDDSFADDLEAIHSAQPPLRAPEWRS